MSEENEKGSLLQSVLLGVISMIVIVAIAEFDAMLYVLDFIQGKPKTEQTEQITKEPEPIVPNERKLTAPQNNANDGTLSIRVEEVGFLGDYEIDQYTVRIQRTSDLSGNYVYDSGEEKIRYSGFFGSSTDFMLREPGYYDVEYSGLTSDGRTAFHFRYSNVKHIGDTEATFYTSDDYSPYIKHY